MLGRPCAWRTTSSALNPYCTAHRDQHRATAGVESTKTPSRSKRIPRVCTSTGLANELSPPQSDIKYRTHPAVACKGHRTSRIFASTKKHSLHAAERVFKVHKNPTR